MKLSSVLVLVATVAASVANASDDIKVGVPESISVPSTELGNPVHLTHSASEGVMVGVPATVGHPHTTHHNFAVGVPVSADHPHHHHRHHHHHHGKDSSASFDGSSSLDGSSDSSSDSDSVVQKSPQELALERLVRIYGLASKHLIDLPTPAPTTYVTPAPTAPTPAPTTMATPAPTAPTPAPTFTVTPCPTVPTPAPTTTFDLSPNAATSDSNNPYIKQVSLPTETPAVTLTVETPTPVVELLRDTEVVGKALTMSASDGSEVDTNSSIAVPAVLLGCVAAALAVAMAVFVNKKRSQVAKTASPNAGEEVDYNNEMVTPV